MRLAKTSKYHNKKTEYNGVLYDSKMEADYAWQLDMRVKAHDITSWERQVRFPMVVDDIKICTYVIDFSIKHTSGEIELIEIKGHETPEFKLKKKLLEALYLQRDPRLKYTILKSV